MAEIINDQSARYFIHSGADQMTGGSRPPPGRNCFYVAAGVSPAVAGGILPPGATPGFQPDSQIVAPSRAKVRFSAGRDARLYGRQDARRYRKMRIRCRRTGRTPGRSARNG
jgi:hypothetical protein